MADEAPIGEPSQDDLQKTLERTFSQAEVDRIVQDRVARVKRELPPEVEEWKAKAAKLEEIEQAQLSELEQAQSAREEAERKAAEAIARANEQLIHAAVLAEATKAKALKPEHMHRLIDTDSVTIGDDGQVIGVQEAIASFLEANPEYVGKRVVDPVDQGARGTTPTQLTRDDLKGMTAEEINKARAEGRTDHLLGRL